LSCIKQCPLFGLNKESRPNTKNIELLSYRKQ
jgi:hypothetical protein